MNIKIKSIAVSILFIGFSNIIYAQLNPAITSWLQNTTGIKGRHYVSGNPVPIQDNDSVNVQTVLYSSNWVYIRTKGVPSYVTGPFLDGNPSITTDQDAIFKISLNPIANTGTLTATKGGNIGQFINGVALFDFRDGAGWNPNTNALCGGPGNPPCPGGMGALQDWNRDAVPAEKMGFDCAKGHPAMGNYHHHQNPSAFKLDLNVISTVCNLYDADGLYVIDSNIHSPLIGFAYDGFPIYGAYAYKEANGTGGIVRMKSSYQLRNISTRTTHADGAVVSPGPIVSATYPLGYFREDYEYIPTTPSTPDYLDEHNGRFCITPEYPNGIYCYFATVNEKWNSAYPYIIGPNYYGIVNGLKVNTITENVTQYNPFPTIVADKNLALSDIAVFPNPSKEILAIQLNGLNKSDVNIYMYDMNGKLIKTAKIYAGNTISYIDINTIYAGNYILEISDGVHKVSKKVIINK